MRSFPRMVIGKAKCPKRVHDDQAKHDPVVSPTDQRLGTTGDQRIVVHARAVESQSSFTAERVIDGPIQGSTRRRIEPTNLAKHKAK